MTDEDALSSYQSFILGLSDQSLVTGISSLIALYAQMCNGLSLFSFQVGISLAIFCASTHFNTFAALRIYFNHNRKQAMTRVCFLVIFLMLALPGIALQDIMYSWDPQISAACSIKWITAHDVRSLSWISLTVYMAYQYYDGIMYVKPRTAEETVHQATRHSPFIRIIRWLPWSAPVQEYFDLALVHLQKDIMSQNEDAVKILRAMPNPQQSRLRRTSKIWTTMLPYLWRDMADSLIVENFTNLFWFGTAIWGVVQQLQVDVDIGPLLSWKYGQWMPVLLILAYIPAAVEAISGSLMS